MSAALREWLTFALSREPHVHAFSSVPEGRVLHDEDLGQAIIDRVLERGRLIRLDGPSVRTLHLKLDEALKDDSDQDDEVARTDLPKAAFIVPIVCPVPNQDGFTVTVTPAMVSPPRH